MASSRGHSEAKVTYPFDFSSKLLISFLTFAIPVTQLLLSKLLPASATWKAFVYPGSLVGPLLPMINLIRHKLEPAGIRCGLQFSYQRYS